MRLAEELQREDGVIQPLGFGDQLGMWELVVGHGKEESRASPGFLAKAEFSGEREWEEGGALGVNDVQRNMLGLRYLWGIHLWKSSRLLDMYWFENS